MAQSLGALVRSGRVSLAEAEMRVSDPSELRNHVKAA
jgi:hypothetical protein